MTDERTTPPANEADKGGQQDPSSSADGQSKTTESTEAPSYQLPEKFRDKRPEEIAKAYAELEGKLGEQSKTVEEAKKAQEQVDTLLRAIWADEDLYRKVEDGIRKYVSGGALPETREPGKKDKKGDEEAGRAPSDPAVSELRVTQENQILKDFYGEYGYNNLSGDERKASLNRLALTLAEIRDPEGKKPIKQVLSEIPLPKLRSFLENAHFVANREKIISDAKRSALVSHEENESATIGSFAASSGQREKSVTLSNRERETAKKMGISEEAYAKRKSQIEAEEKRFS